jgi:hypothetical protein
MSFPQQSARPRYSMSQHGQGSTDNFGNMILRSGGGNLRRPSWDKTETVVRFLPCIDPDGNWTPFRNSMSPRDFGDWLRGYPAVRNFGENGGVTMLLFNQVEQPAYDMHQNPCVMLYDAVNNAIRNKQERPGWASLTKGGPGKGPVLSRPTDVYLARAAIFRIKNEDKATGDRSPIGLSVGEPAMFLEMSDSAGRALIEMLEERDNDYEFPTDGDIDFNLAYKSGDIIALDKGAFVHFYQFGYDPRENASAASQGPRQVVVGGSRGGKSNEPAKRYACFTSPEWKGFAPQFNSEELEDIIRGKAIRPWDDSVHGPGTGVLNFMSPEGQARVLQERDCFPADMFLYAWQDHPDWIIERTRDRAAGRTGVLMPDSNTGRWNSGPGGHDGPTGPVGAPARNPVNPPTTPAAKPQQTPRQSGKVGGWGNKAWEETAEGQQAKAPAADETVQKAPEVGEKPAEEGQQATVAENANTAAPANEREAAALKAMEEAKAKARRPVPTRPQS